MRVAGMIPHVFCPDPEATARWLGEYLGLAELTRATAADGTVVEVRLDSPGGRIWLQQGTPPEGQWTGFMIDDLDAARAALGSAAGAPEALPDGGRFATVTDPTGLAWRLVESTPRPASPRLSALRGDITTQDVGAIVNAANSSLLGGGGVDGAIHAAAGPRLVEFCRGLGGCQVGESKTSPGFDLPAQYVIHTVGPIWHDGTHGEPELLASCYRTALAEADANGVTSIAFPAISTGIFGYPVEAAAKVAVATVRETPTKVTDVRFVAFDQRTLDAYEAQLAGV